MTGKQKREQEKARRAAAERETAEYLKEHKAWNWQWPDGNCWDTGGAKVKGPSQAYHGPSKRTVAGRARRHESKRAHKYVETALW